MKAIPVFRTFPALLAAGALLLGCEAQHPIAAPDDFQPQFAKGGKPGGGPNAFVPIPINLYVTGGFIIDEDAWIRFESETELGFGTMDGVAIWYTVNFAATAAEARLTNFASCASKYGNNRRSGPISDEDANRLIDWLGYIDPTGVPHPGFHREGWLDGHLDLASVRLETASEGNSVGTRPMDDPNTPEDDRNEHVGLGYPPTYQYFMDQGWLPRIDPPTVTGGLISAPGQTPVVEEYTFEGGIVQMWDRSADGLNITLQCPNMDVLTVRITRLQ